MTKRFLVTIQGPEHYEPTAEEVRRILVADIPMESVVTVIEISDADARAARGLAVE